MRGIHTALVTPFAADGSVDLDAYRLLAKRQLEAGIHGLVPCGTTGETPTLTQREWDDCLAVALEVADGAPVTVGVGTNATASTVAFTRRARQAGASHGLLVFPYYNKPNPEGLRLHVSAAAAEGLPLVLYHVPGRTGQRLPSSLLCELAGIDGVIAVKEATGDLRYGTDVILGTDVPILSGDDFTFLGLLSHGGAGCISVVSNVAPALTVGIYDDFVAGRVDSAREGIARLYPLIAYLFSDTNPTPSKACLAELGLCRPDTRLPLATYQGPSCRALLESLELT